MNKNITQDTILCWTLKKTFSLLRHDQTQNRPSIYIMMHICCILGLDFLLFQLTTHLQTLSHWIVSHICKTNPNNKYLKWKKYKKYKNFTIQFTCNWHNPRFSMFTTVAKQQGGNWAHKNSLVKWKFPSDLFLHP